jgi:hypothetical protein
MIQQHYLPTCASSYPQKCGLKSSEPKSGLVVEKFSTKKKQISDSFPLLVIGWLSGELHNLKSL